MVLGPRLRAKVLNIENKSLNNNFPYNYLKGTFKLLRKVKYDDSFENLKNFYNKTKNYSFDTKLHIDSKSVPIANLETNNTCNLNCPMCDTRSQTRKKLNLEIENLEKIIILAVKRNKENKNNDNVVSFHTVGEPILSPNFEEYLKILKKYNFKLSLSTNGILIDRKIDILCKYAEQIEDIRFSIEGATKETYEIMRFPAKYEKLIENLEIFTKVNKNNKYFKDVRLSSVICKTTLPELALHFEVYGKYIPVSNMGFALINSLAPTNNFFDNDKILTKHLILNNPCGAIFGKSHHILANGDVTPCSRDYNGEIIVGNVFKEDFDSIVNSKKSVDLRQEQLEGKNAQDLLCAKCYNVDPRVRMMWDRFFESVRYHYLYNNKSIAQIQSKVQNFFNKFEEKYPDLEEFTELFDFENDPSMNY